MYEKVVFKYSLIPKAYIQQGPATSDPRWSVYRVLRVSKVHAISKLASGEWEKTDALLLDGSFVYRLLCRCEAHEGTGSFNMVKDTCAT